MNAAQATEVRSRILNPVLAPRPVVVANVARWQDYAKARRAARAFTLKGKAVR